MIIEISGNLYFSVHSEQSIEFWKRVGQAHLGTAFLKNRSSAESQHMRKKLKI